MFHKYIGLFLCRFNCNWWSLKLLYYLLFSFLVCISPTQILVEIRETLSVCCSCNFTAIKYVANSIKALRASSVPLLVSICFRRWLVCCCSCCENRTEEKWRNVFESGSWWQSRSSNNHGTVNQMMCVSALPDCLFVCSERVLLKSRAKMPVGHLFCYVVSE